MAMYNFVSPFRKAKFCGVPSRVFEKSGCAAGKKKMLRSTAKQYYKPCFSLKNGKMYVGPP
jgi:hypothetical protein